MVGCLLKSMLESFSLPHCDRAGHLGAAGWKYNALGDILAIAATCFSGTFALFNVRMLHKKYWVTVALDSISPECKADDTNK